MCGLSHIGSNLRHMYSRVGAVGAINNKRSTQWELLKLYTCATNRGGAKDISMDDTSKVHSAHDPTNCFRRCALAHEEFYKESQTTHATPIVSQSVDCESLTPTQGAIQQSVDCESLTPTQGATQQSMDCESLTPPPP